MVELGSAIGEAERVGDPFPFPETAFLKLPLGLLVWVIARNGAVTFSREEPCHLLVPMSVLHT